MEHGDSFSNSLVVVSVSVGHLLDRVGKSAHPRGRVDNSLNDMCGIGFLNLLLLLFPRMYPFTFVKLPL